MNQITKRKIAGEAMFGIFMIVGILLSGAALIIGMILYFPAWVNVGIVILVTLGVLVKSFYEHLLDEYKTKGYAIV